MVKISDIGECGLIERLAGIFPPGRKIIKGIGDDCAVIRYGNRFLLFTTDALIENVHFDLKYTPPLTLGYKALAVNLSDIASMAGNPLAAVVTFGAPPNLDIDFALKFARGLQNCAHKYHCPVIGGDTVESPKGVFISVAIIGECSGRPILRNGARPGDLVAVAGNLGESIAGLRLLKSVSGKNSLSPDNVVYRKKIVKAHLRPEPLINEALMLRKRLKLHSMIDISDGLSSELNHISKSSGVKITIDAKNIPITRSLRQYCKQMGYDPINMALSGGEDYSLLFTFSGELYDKLKSPDLKIPIAVIGEVQPGKGVSIRIGNEEILLRPNSYSHF